MSKKLPGRKTSLKYNPKQALKPLAKIKTEWDLEKLYYKSESDPRIEADVKLAEKAYLKFAKKWRQVNFVDSPSVLAKALKEKELLASLPEASRVSRYFSFRSTIDTNDKIAEQKLALLSRRFRKVSDQMLFFELTLGQLSKNRQTKLLKNPALKHYRYYLEDLFNSAKYDLSEEQEKIINLKSSQSYGRWVNMTEKIVSNRVIKWAGKNVAIPEALETLNVTAPKQKPKLWSLIMDQMQQISEVAEHEFNAIITDVRTEESLRGYKKPYSSTIISYEDDETSVENLIKVVSTEGFKLSQKFYKLKAKYHKVKSMAYPNKYDGLGTEPVIPFTDAVEICRDVFYGLKPTYGKIFDNMLLNGQIDVYPKLGKRGGAFMSDSIANPTHVFLNHLDDFKSLETLAHEMGHAIHSERSKIQSPFYQGHSITTAETASTLFENLVFDAVYEQLPESKRMSMLHDRITRDIATIQRQIACFNAELEIHNTIYENGAMSKVELANCLTKHMKAYLGPSVEVTEQDGYSFVYWSHLRYGFYVYTYSFGLLMSTVMAKKYQLDNNYIETIDKFLQSGTTGTVANIFNSIGIDVKSKTVFEDALNNQADNIKNFARFVNARVK